MRRGSVTGVPDKHIEAERIIASFCRGITLSSFYESIQMLVIIIKSLWKIGTKVWVISSKDKGNFKVQRIIGVS